MDREGSRGAGQGRRTGIGATTLSEYRKHIEKDAALERRFQPVIVEQPSIEETISILRGLKQRYEVYHGERIQDSALVAAATLSQRYITDRFLPDKAIDLINEACKLVCLQKSTEIKFCVQGRCKQRRDLGSKLVHHAGRGENSILVLLCLDEAQNVLKTS